MSCCSKAKTAKPTPIQETSTLSIIEQNEIKNEYYENTKVDIIESPPIIIDNFCPRKISRPNSQNKKENRPGSARGTKFPKFTNQQKEQLWLDARILQLRQQFTQMGVQLDDKTISDIAQSEFRKVKVDKNVVKQVRFQEQEPSDKEFGELSDESDVQEDDKRGVFTVEFIEKKIKNSDLAIAKSKSEEKLQELLGENIQNVPTIKKDLEKSEKLVLGDVVFD